MKSYVLALIVCLSVYPANAESPAAPAVTPSSATAFNESVAQQGEEVQVVSANGALTRRPCPYTCEDRQLPSEHCKTWESKDKTLCYVWDTRLPQNAVPIH